MVGERTSIAIYFQKNFGAQQNLIETGFSQDTVFARKKYRINGQNLTDREWQLSDQYGYISGITVYRIIKLLNTRTSHLLNLLVIFLTIPDMQFIQPVQITKKYWLQKK